MAAGPCELNMKLFIMRATGQIGFNVALTMRHAGQEF
jgi:hypothetical protein